MNLTSQWLMNFLPMSKRRSRLLGCLLCVCLLSFFAPIAKPLAQESVVALDPAVTMASELADTEERRHLEAPASPTLSLRHPKPSSPVQMPDDWCGPLWLRPPISAA
jgi:hypothetical protein